MKKFVYKYSALVLLAASMAACSSMPAPKTEMALSESAVKGAEMAGAREHAPLELRRANEKLDKAKNAIIAEDYETAKRMAEQATVDAALAESKSDSMQSKLALQEIKDSIALMREEISRAQGS